MATRRSTKTKTTTKTKSTRSSTRKRSSSKKKTSFATNMMLMVLSVIVAAIAYKQIILVSQVASHVPEAKLTQALEVCLQENLTPNMLQQTWAGNNLSDSFSFNVQNLLGNVWGQVSQNLVETNIIHHYITETKVMKVQDWLGKQAEIRLTGSLELVSKIPVIGDIDTKKNYQLHLFKRNEQYYFDGLSIKNADSQQWDKWACAQTLS